MFDTYLTSSEDWLLKRLEEEAAEAHNDKEPYVCCLEEDLEHVISMTGSTTGGD